jgi:hypothetical protein
MRFALSAAAAACGLLFLGLAFFGQPEVYLRQARAQLESLTEIAAPEPAPSQADSLPAPAMAARMDELQRQVLLLRDELITRREEADRAREALALAQAQQQAAEAQRQAAEQAPPPQPAEQPPVTPPEPQSQPAQSVPVPEHQDAAAAPVPDRHEPAPQAERHAASKPSNTAPRLAPRQEAENTQSVLARLRQASPVAAEPADSEPPPERVNHGPSPALRRLFAARSALANSQIEETRRLLQEAQLELVFRPGGSPGDDTGSASRAASDVAHALEALSGADLSASRGYIDRAVNDSSGSAAEAADRAGPPAVPGYAPAYPER